MPRQLNLPDSASVADSHEDGRMFAPSTARNAAAILEVLQRIAPRAGTALEIASGTGEHILLFAEAMPGLVWQPSEVDDTRITSIRAWTRDCSNILDPIKLDATVAGWSQRLDPPSLIFLSNLLHLISETEARTLVLEAARALSPGGTFLIYGPFRRGAEFASEGDQRFHADLSAQDPAIGYKAFETVQAWQSEGGLHDRSVTEMPANNLILAARSRS
jgi:SAM-dependent methyltransferase